MSLLEFKRITTRSHSAGDPQASRRATGATTSTKMASEQTPLMRVEQPSGEAGEESTGNWFKQMVNPPMRFNESFRQPEASTVSYALLGSRTLQMNSSHLDSRRTYSQGGWIRGNRHNCTVEPKVFFANERTYLAWMHIAIILAGTSVAVSAIAESRPGAQLEQYYGLALLPVSIAFVIYATVQYVRRGQLARRKAPIIMGSSSLFEDEIGPRVLCGFLVLSLVGTFVLKLMTATS